MSKLKVVREQLNSDLVAFVKKGHGVIYGAPGAGKSYAAKPKLCKSWQRL